MGTLAQELGDDGAVMVLQLEPGATAVYHRPEEVPSLITNRYDEITLVLFLELGAPADVPIDFDLYLNDDPKTRGRRTMLEVFQGVYEFRLDHEIGKFNANLETLSITNVNRFPITLYLKRIAIG